MRGSAGAFICRPVPGRPRLRDALMTDGRRPPPAGCAAGDRHPGALSGNKPRPGGVARWGAGTRRRHQRRGRYRAAYLPGLLAREFTTSAPGAPRGRHTRRACRRANSRRRGPPRCPEGEVAKGLQYVRPAYGLAWALLYVRRPGPRRALAYGISESAGAAAWPAQRAKEKSIGVITRMPILAFAPERFGARSARRPRRTRSGSTQRTPCMAKRALWTGR